MLMSRSSAVRASLCNDAKVSVDYIEACGDCFYMAVSAALADTHGWSNAYAVAQLRKLVAAHMTEETYQLYSVLHTEQAEGFHFMANVDSLDALRERVKLRGQKVGAQKCVWADGFAMETIANYYRVLLLIIDERFASEQRFTRIVPSSATASSSEPQASEQLCDETMAVILHASKSEHMNLVIYDGKKLPKLGDLPQPLLDLWGIRDGMVASSARPSAAATDVAGTSASHAVAAAAPDSPPSAARSRKQLKKAAAPAAAPAAAAPAAAADGASSARRKRRSSDGSSSGGCTKNMECVRPFKHPGLCKVMVDGVQVTQPRPKI